MTTEGINGPKDDVAQTASPSVADLVLMGDAVRTERVKTPLLGILAVGLVVLAAIVQGVAIVMATDNRYLVSTVLGYGAVAASILGFLVGAAAAVLSLGRRWGIAAMLLSLVANPIVVLNVLTFFSGSPR